MTKLNLTYFKQFTKAKKAKNKKKQTNVSTKNKYNTIKFMSISGNTI